MAVRIKKIPQTLEEFTSMPQQDLSNPENTCALFLCALQLYLEDQNDGLAAIDLLRGPRPMLPYDKQFLRDRLRGKEYLPMAYFEGADPSNNYVPAKPYTLNVLPDPRGNSTQEGYLKVFIKTAGADSPRPVTLRRKGSSWYLWEYSSILTGIRIPAAEELWT